MSHAILMEQLMLVPKPYTFVMMRIRLHLPSLLDDTMVAGQREARSCRRDNHYEHEPHDVCFETFDGNGC